MVVFTCQHCGESVKKNAVEKHQFKCRNALFLTCVDCLKDFRNDEYVGHMSCLTEGQRYGGKDYVAKPTALKQNEWLQVCEKVLQFNKSLSNQQRKLLQLCSTYSNVPRNEYKFLNFIKNVGQDMRHDVKLAKSVFEIINKAYKEEKAALQNNKKNTIMSNTENGSDNNESNQTDSVDPVNEPEMNNEDEIGPNSSDDKKKSKKEKSETKLKKFKNSGDNNDCSEVISAKKQLSKKEKKKLKLLQTENGVQNVSEIDELPEQNDSPNEKANDLNSEASEKKSNSNSVTEGNVTLTCIQNEGLSRKERKRKLKQDKYEAEIRAIESHQMEVEYINEDSEVVKKKKKKKRAVEEPENEVNEIVSSKKEDKEIFNTSLSCADNSGIEVEPSGKFNWQESIIKLLQASSDKEMALKRLCKKVVAEYEFQKGLRESHEKIVAKFNKKIQKTVGVRVLKDRAKLILTEDGQSVS